MEAAKAFGLAYKVDEATLKSLEGYGIDLKENSGEHHEMLPVPKRRFTFQLLNFLVLSR